MTHYWWMHWFWITCLIQDLSCMPLSQDALQFEKDVEDIQPNERYGRAMYNTNKNNITIVTPTLNENKTLFLMTKDDIGKIIVGNSTKFVSNNTNPDFNDETVLVDSKVKGNDSTKASNVSMTLNNTQVDRKNIVVEIVTGKAEIRKIVVDNKSVLGGDELEFNESRNLLTEKPLQLEATVVKSKPLEGIAHPREQDPDGSRINAGIITGICFASIALIALVGTTSFVLYRRRYLNKPQTLNDKCSNPDSSGYLDDSTIRDNSEEMYSLDNDSFLNSLEAMTIQNYWTDTVKHTKL